MDTPETGKKIRVLLAEDHTLVRQGFRRILEDDPKITVVGEARTGLEAMELCKNFEARSRGDGPFHAGTRRSGGHGGNPEG